MPGRTLPNTSVRRKCLPCVHWLEWYGFPVNTIIRIVHEELVLAMESHANHESFSDLLYCVNREFRRIDFLCAETQPTESTIPGIGWRLGCDFSFGSLLAGRGYPLVLVFSPRYFTCLVECYYSSIDGCCHHLE